MPTKPVGDEGPGPKKKAKAKKATPKEKFIWAEGVQESGNDYGIVNNKSGALGRWQIMPANLPGWAAQCGLKVETPGQFLADHKYQDEMVWCILGGYYDTYGAAGAAAEWYSGQPDPNKTYGDPTVRQYVNDVLAILKRAPAILPAATGFSVEQLGPVVFEVYPLPPKPAAENWSASIGHASAEFRNGTKGYATHIKAISNLKVRR